MHDRRLSSDCQMYSEDYLTNELENEFDYKKKLNINHEHFQQRLNRCSTTLEQKQQLQNQIQLNIEQLQREIEQTKTTVINEKQVKKYHFLLSFRRNHRFRISININMN